MPRVRFNAAEKSVIADAIAGDRRVEVQNVTQWHGATITAGARIERDQFGVHRVACTIDSTRGTVRAGDPWPASPGHVRARLCSDADCAHPVAEHDANGCIHKMARADWCESGTDPDVYCHCTRRA